MHPPKGVLRLVRHCYAVCGLKGFGSRLSAGQQKV